MALPFINMQSLLAVTAGLALNLASVSAQDIEEDGQVRGVVKARQEAQLTVSSKLTVAEIPFRTGEVFKQGDLLIRFECDVQKAEADAAQAAYLAAKSRYESNLEMKSHDAIGQFDVDLSKAEMEEAHAQARAGSARIKQCEIAAPFGGKVAEVTVNAFETPSPDQPLMKIVGNMDLELQLIVPSHWLVWLAPGQTFTFEVDETGELQSARVLHIGAEVDAVSRTVPIIAVFEDASEKVLPGMSGTALFTPPAG